MNITTQSKIPLFVLKHLANYMLANYGKTTVFRLRAGQYAHMRSKDLSAYFFVRMRARRDYCGYVLSACGLNIVTAIILYNDIGLVSLLFHRLAHFYYCVHTLF